MKLQRFKVLLDGDFPCPSIQDMENGDILPLQSLEIVMAEDVGALEAEIERVNKLLTKDLMYWESSRVEDNASEEPWEIADRVADEYIGPGEGQVVEVQVAARLPDRKMRVWRDESGEMKWEWVE